MDNTILNKLPDTFKDKLKGLGVRKTSKMIHQLVKQYKILWNTLSREGQEMFAAELASLRGRVDALPLQQSSAHLPVLSVLFLFPLSEVKPR